MISSGVDLVEIRRISDLMEHPNFFKKILGNNEYSELEKRNFPHQSVAANFCAKEAFSKAMGTGIRNFKLSEVEVLRNAQGKPYFKFRGEAKRVVCEKKLNFSLSITHTKEYALAVVVAYKNIEDEKILDEIVNVNFLKESLPVFSSSANKKDRGRLFSFCSSVGMVGASVMAAKAALRSGVGLLDMAVVNSNYPIVASKLDEPIFSIMDSGDGRTYSYKNMDKILQSLSRADACLIGCGLGVSDDTVKIVNEMIKFCNIPLVIDADGINILSKNIGILKGISYPVVLTPHPGEMARLLGVTADYVQKNRHDIAKKFAIDNGVILVLKGEHTLVSSPSGEVFMNSTGNNGLAKGGSGDVLAGILSSFLAQGMDAFKAAKTAVFLHGLAADVCIKKHSKTYMLPTDIINELQYIFLEIEH